MHRTAALPDAHRLGFIGRRLKARRGRRFAGWLACRFALINQKGKGAARSKATAYTHLHHEPIAPPMIGCQPVQAR